MTGAAAAPRPQGDYVLATRAGTLVFTAGMTPRRDGVLIQKGPIRADAPPEFYRAAVELAAANALAAARSVLAASEDIAAILGMTVYLATEPGFENHARIADFASRHLDERLGDKSRCSRCTVGVMTLPGGAPVEIQLTVAVAPSASDPMP